jgi:hypothetical protein
VNGWKKALTVTLILTQALILASGLGSCAVLEVRIERTPTPDLSAIGTMAALMAEGTRYAAQIEEIRLALTPTPSSGSVSGEICYPSERIPAMLISFHDLATGRVIELQTADDQSDYDIDLPPGEYYAYAWVERYQVGGMYTEMVACQPGEECLDHSPRSFEVSGGRSTPGIDLCDWAFALEDLPALEAQPEAASPAAEGE